MSVCIKVTTASVTVTNPKNVRGRCKKRRKERRTSSAVGGLYITVLNDTLRSISSSDVLIASKENLPTLNSPERGVIPIPPMTSAVVARILAGSTCKGSSCGSRSTKFRYKVVERERRTAPNGVLCRRKGSGHERTEEGGS